MIEQNSRSQLPRKPRLALKGRKARRIGQSCQILGSIFRHAAAINVVLRFRQGDREFFQPI
jgi:hypothetical protein